MADDKSGDICELCRRGRKIRRNEELAFNQWTDRGYVSCRVTIPISTCDHCGAKSWDEAAEAMLEGWRRGAFEIHFPRRFTFWMKLMRLLPYRLYFPAVARFTGL